MNEELKKSWKQIKTWTVVLSIGIIILGLVMIIWPNISALTVCIILGIVCIGMGIVEVVRYFKLGLAGIFFHYDLILAIGSILMGLLMVARSSNAVVFLPIAAGIYIIFASVLDIQMSVELHRFGSKNWLTALVLGILGVALSFVLLLDPFNGASILAVLTGIALIVNGTQDLYQVASISKAIKEGKNGRIIEADWRTIE